MNGGRRQPRRCLWTPHGPRWMIRRSLLAATRQLQRTQCHHLQGLLRQHLQRSHPRQQGVTSQTLLEPVRRFVRNKQLIMIILATVTGAAAALGAVLFRETVVLIQTGTFGASLENSTNVIQNLPGWQVVTVPTIGGLLIGLFVYYFMPGMK